MDKVISSLLLVLASIAILSAVYLNQLPNDCWIKYFNIPFKELINIAVVVIAVYYFVEYKNDTRATKQYLNNLCERVINRLENNRMYVIKEEKDIKYIRVQQRIIKNELDLLTKKANDFGYGDDIDYCKENFDKYWDLVSTHLTDFSTLCKIEINLQNQLACVVNRIETISLKLYR